MRDEKLSGALQENVLTLLCFSEDFATTIRHSITQNLFESAVFREIAGHAIDFIDQFKKPIGEHLPDSLETILKGSDKRKARSYTGVIDNLFGAKNDVNGPYVLSKLNEFVRQQHLKSGVVAAVAALEDGRTFDAKIIGTDPVMDIGVLKIDAQKLPVVQLGNSDALFVGQTVLAIGNSLAEFQNSVTMGIVSGLSRQVVAGDPTVTWLVLPPPDLLPMRPSTGDRPAGQTLSSSGVTHAIPGAGIKGQCALYITKSRRCHQSACRCAAARTAAWPRAVPR